MTIETMVREFRYDEIRLPDPNPRLSVDEVRTAFSATYPEIATAALTGPEAVGNKLVYHFAKAIGTKAIAIMIAITQKGLKPAGLAAGRRSCPKIPARRPVMP